ncbi:MAG: hypothetical protein COU90_00155 [Candidatus Ryanbacteria bacterium CG10_big_fil_rev_8_21_14_0_10_43_42]|uniref:Uncharacterized protein n=1 Tax=Candidatus Ryanbacteria bacterium CG10_big_fil_rev_8_21_14_0_10_43_42 TaxID=1974864 RepID=A0A2M8KYF0_9BACT|nr:MAG: hypothetical protein COU90_00155 [Candidatus Ryanbacteria bacterium CG10_big_fil_rev_8_21_14_0_10_43_42]
MQKKRKSKTTSTVVKRNETPNLLEEVELNPQQIAGVLAEATSGAIVSSIPGLNKLFEWVERIDQASREEKLKTLLREYTVHFESVDNAISRLKLLTSTRGGQTLFRKIIQIIDKGAEDLEWIRLLAMALRRISEAEFEKCFDAQNNGVRDAYPRYHRYSLMKITRCLKIY